MGQTLLGVKDPGSCFHPQRLAHLPHIQMGYTISAWGAGFWRFPQKHFALETNSGIPSVLHRVHKILKGENSCSICLEQLTNTEQSE